MLAAAAASMPCTSAAFAELSAEILQAGMALRFQARGTSMLPLVRDGDVVLVRPVDPDELRVGDVVLCRSHPGRIVVHRVVKVLANSAGVRYTVQGDQLTRPDGRLPAAQIYGRVASIERDGATIDVGRPAMRTLGWLAVLRARWNLGRGDRLQRARRWVKRLPGLSRYLA
jgi:signal peptidase